MLQSRNLDDQPFDEIMEYAIGRLPWIAPGWTDHNAHDPGITILELMAWYKEMQQYHMNVMTDDLRKKLLKLLGVSLRGPKLARCYIELPDVHLRYPARSRLYSADGIPFEVCAAVGGGVTIEGVYTLHDGTPADITEFMRQPDISIWPFRCDGARTELLIGMDAEGVKRLRLWFTIEDTHPVKRNPFKTDTESPREIAWEFVGAGTAVPETDDTHALSVSGFVTFQAPDNWGKSDGGCGLPSNWYLKLSLLDAGCEEEVKLAAISGLRFEAEQVETWCHYNTYTVPSGMARIALRDAISLEGQVSAFIREPSGLNQVSYTEDYQDGARVIAVDANTAAQDGLANLFLASVNPLHVGDVLFNATGLPDMEIVLALNGRHVLPDRFTLVCDSVHEDGVIRPAIWTYAEDLYQCGPRDRVFTYDAERERIRFGNGEHGAIVPGGEGRILIVSMALSLLNEGNAPADSGLRFSDGVCVKNTAARGGMYRQTVEEASLAFIRRLDLPKRCVSQADYERAACATPGLRVAAARAIAGFDADEPTGRSKLPVVTVVVIPFGAEGRAMPDARFILKVRRHLESMRPICTVIKVMSPRYIPIHVSVKFKVQRKPSEQTVHAALSDYFSVKGGASIGQTVVKNELSAALLKLEGMFRIERLDLSPMAADCRTLQNGDVSIPRNAVAYLGKLDIEFR